MSPCTGESRLRRPGWPSIARRFTDRASSQIDGRRDMRAGRRGLAERLPEPLAPLARIAYNYRWSWLPDGPELFARSIPRASTSSGQNPVGLLQESPAQHLGAPPPMKRCSPGARDLLAASRPTRAAGHPAHRSGPAGRVPVRRVRRPRLTARLLRRTRGAGRRHPQGGLRPGRPARRGRADVPQGLLPPAGRRAGWQHEYWIETDPERLPAALVTGEAGRRHGQVADRRQATSPPASGASTSAACRCTCSTPTARERAARSLDHRPAVRRGPDNAAVAVLAARRRRYPRAARVGLRAGRDPSQRGARRARAAGARAGARTASRCRPRRAREPTVFTTHTPVVAGNDSYPPEQVERAITRVALSLGMPVAQLIGLGQHHRTTPPSRSASPRRRCG